MFVGICSGYWMKMGGRGPSGVEEVGEEVVKEPAKETSDLSMRAALKYWPYRLQIHFSTDANDTRDGT